MARRLLPSHSAALGLSVFLFTFAFLPTLVVLLAVIVFFVFFYPRLRKSDCEYPGHIASWFAWLISSLTGIPTGDKRISSE